MVFVSRITRAGILIWALIFLTPVQCYSRYLFLIDKEVEWRTRECTIYVVQSTEGRFYLCGKLRAICGRSKKRKRYEGDGRTPEGKYLIARIVEMGYSRKFGPGFLKLNYPNHWDRREGRTGKGIGIHGGSRFTYTLGCVRVRNSDFRKLRRIVQVLDPVLIVPNICPDFLPSFRRYRWTEFSPDSIYILDSVLTNNTDNNTCINLISCGSRRRYRSSQRGILEEVGIVF